MKRTHKKSESTHSQRHTRPWTACDWDAIPSFTDRIAIDLRLSAHQIRRRFAPTAISLLKMSSVRDAESSIHARGRQAPNHLSAVHASTKF